MPRETESNLQAWKSNPKSSESHKCPNEDIEQSIDLRVDGIPDYETYKDEQYMQRFAEQIQKFMVTKRNLTRRLISGQHSQWEDCEENSWSRQLRVTWKFSKELTKYNVNVAARTLRLDFKYVHAEENWTCLMKSFQASDKKLSNSLPMLTWHSKEREEPGMVFSHGKSIISLPKSLCERSTRRESRRRFLNASRTMKYFMQASYNITGRKNGANIWITSEQSILRTMPLQNNWNDTQRCIIFGTIRNKWRKAPNEKAPRLPSNNTGNCQHERRSGADSRIEKTT